MAIMLRCQGHGVGARAVAWGGVVPVGGGELVELKVDESGGGAAVGGGRLQQEFMGERKF